MSHFRDARPGMFYANNDRLEPPPHRSEKPAFLRFAGRQGVALGLWAGEGATAPQVVHAARLMWPVERRRVIVPAGRGVAVDTEARHYRALVRPDTEEIMSLVTASYAHAENEWVAEAVEGYARRVAHRPPMIASASFGRSGERTLFAARVTGDARSALCLLAWNTHGGEGALRFQLIEADRVRQTTYVIDSPHNSRSFPHVGDLRDRLARAPRGIGETFIERFLETTPPLWDRLEHTPWRARDTAALIRALWGSTPETRIQGPNALEAFDHDAARHPGHHLPSRMDGIKDAAEAYRSICDWIDNQSEACERGDFTKDRDERLALGAGNRYKRDAWRWILTNT